ncbi:hypothetical protein Tco_0905834 [Tanacetum coccineum]
MSIQSLLLKKLKHLRRYVVFEDVDRSFDIVAISEQSYVCVFDESSLAVALRMIVSGSDVVSTVTECVMSRSFYNSIMKEKIEYKGKNVVGVFMNVPIFVENFSIVIDFAIMEDMDAYRDKNMGDVIVRKTIL